MAEPITPEALEEARELAELHGGGVYLHSIHFDSHSDVSRLIAHVRAAAVPASCAECGKTSTPDSMWALYCIGCIKTKIGPALPVALPQLVDAEIDALDIFALHCLAPRGRDSVRAFARAVEVYVRAAATAAERERCAKLCEPLRVADEIRRGGE